MQFRNLLAISDKDFYISNAVSCWLEYKRATNLTIAMFYLDKAKQYLKDYLQQKEQTQ